MDQEKTSKDINDMSSETRNEQIKGCFLDIYRKFIDEVEPYCILDWLIQERIINIEEKERIISQPTRHDKCRMLLDKLFMTSNKKAFVLIYNVLYENYHWLAEDIDNCISKFEKEKQSASNESHRDIQKKLDEALLTIEKLHSELDSKNEKISSLESSLVDALTKIEQFKRSTKSVTVDSPNSSDSLELYLELNKKSDEIKKLENHIVILETQIKNAAAMNKSIGDGLDERESFRSKTEILENEFSVLGYNDEHFSENQTEDKNDQNSFLRIFKLATYSGSCFDLWHGAFGPSDRIVMIKDLLKNPTKAQIRKFANEIEIVKSLKHPRLCNMLSYSIMEGNYHIIYEGSSLPNVLNMFKNNMYVVPVDDIFRWIVQLASGLDYLHSNLIIHRNVFAHNLITCNGSKSIKLTNFSHARRLNKAHDKFVEEKPLINAENLAPEIITKNEWSMKSDVWSFGMTVLKLLLRGKKLFPEMTERDIKSLMTNWTINQFDKLFSGRLRLTKNLLQVKCCLDHVASSRPNMCELSTYSNYVDNLSPKFSLSHSFEQTLVHKCTVKGITTLKDNLYVIVVSSSSIKCFKKSRKFERVHSIKLGNKKTKSLTNFLKLQRNNSSTSIVSTHSGNQSPKVYTFSSNILTSITSSEVDQCLYVLDGHKKIIFQINAEKRRVTSSFDAHPGAHNISVTPDNTLLINCGLEENFIIECTNNGSKIRVINVDFPNSEPKRAIKINPVHYLFFHKPRDVRDETLTLNVVDNDSIPSSGYGTLCLTNISDVAIHQPSGMIFWTDYSGNKVMYIDQYMNGEPHELLNAENGIFNPVKIYVSDEGQLFVGLTSGTIRFFQFDWKSLKFSLRYFCKL